jgi:hypothetical protein
MATNDILKFAGSAVSMLGDAAYALLNEAGHEIGVADPELANKVLKQSSLMASGLGDFIVNNQSLGIFDDLLPSQVAARLELAVDARIPVVPDASTTVKGKIEIADTAETQAWASLLLALTPGGLDVAFKGANQSLTTNGFQKFPGGLIIAWGQGSASNDGEQNNFPAGVGFTTVFTVFICDLVANSSATRTFQSVDTSSITTSKFDAYNELGSGLENMYWFAIGK